MSIRLRLTLWYSGILAVTLILFGFAVYYFLSYTLEDNLRKSLENQADIVATRIQPVISISPQGGFSLIPELLLDNYDIRSSSVLLQIYNIRSGLKSKSQLLTRFQLELPVDKRLIEDVLKKGKTYTTANLGGVQWLIYSRPLALSDGELLGILQVALPTDQQKTFFDTLQYVFALGVILTIGLAATIGWFLARKALRPIERVISDANQIGGGIDLSRRIEHEGPRDEIGRLTETINGMLSRIQIAYSELEDAYATQRRFVSDASHELRTPLTTIRGNVDFLEKMWSQQLENINEQPLDQDTLENSREAMRDIADEARRMSGLVNDLLHLARADAGLQMTMEELWLSPLVEEVVRRSQYLPRNVDWVIDHLEVLEGIKIKGNKDYLQQMLFVFIENAFKYTLHGTVKLDALVSGPQVGIRISDTGIGMEKEDVPRIFDRFYRADVSRGQTEGTGLGLSIAKWIIDEHHGSVEVMTRKDEGTVFIIWLPIIP